MRVPAFVRRAVVNFKYKVLKMRPDPKTYSTIVGAWSIIPCQQEAYLLAMREYTKDGDRALDVGFGLGYGMNTLSIKASEVYGVDVDHLVLDFCNAHLYGKNPKIKELGLYDGYKLDYKDNFFDIVTIVDVLEHVEDYDKFLKELLRVSRRGVFISTPNRRPEYTNKDGTPKNRWHLREWSYEELDKILSRHGKVDWNFLNGPFKGPFTISKKVQDNTLTLTPFLKK
ncbi:MAG TPA: class I SAM-dependent methyltransferase [Candidatus Dojkabacteria bacterium]|mgnify:CR=1 FL=1|nr:class I SAM-dependent methyltransferase [Candidatus Dojkabacteria bacterium]